MRLLRQAISTSVSLMRPSREATPVDLLDAYPRLTPEDIRAAMGYTADTVAHEETVLLASSDSSSET